MVGGNTMITQKFLFFSNYSTFQSKLSTDEIGQHHIAFIKDINAIWTHGKFFYGLGENLSTELAKYATKEELAALQTAVNAITIPTKVSDLTNDSEFQTKAQVDARIEALVGAAPEALDTLEEIASKLNQNDTVVAAINGVLAGKADTTYVDAEVAKLATKEELTAVDAKVDAIVIPTNVSELTNDANYLVASDVANLATKTELEEAFGWYEESAE